MAINNDVKGVVQYLQKLNTTLVMYITIPRGNLQRDIKEWRDIHTETCDPVESIIRKVGNLCFTRSTQSGQQSRNTGRMRCIHSISAYSNATGSSARFSARITNSSIPWRVTSTSLITTRSNSTASVAPDSSSANQSGHCTDFLTFSLSSARCPQRAQRDRIIPTHHPLECRCPRAETRNEVTSRGVYAR